MPRQPRIDAPGVVHHVVLKGIEGRIIFLDDGDREDLLGRLCRILPESGCECLVWTFMENHIHAVLRTGSSPLSQVMHRLNTGYAGRFNTRHDRQGYVFKNRFWSRPVCDDEGLRTLVRYVLQNPVRAGVVSTVHALETYSWTAYGALLAQRSAMPFESVETTWELFDPDPGAARRLLRALMGAKVPCEPKLPSRSTEARPPSAAPQTRSLDEIVTLVTSTMSIDSRRLHGPRWGGGVADARAAIAFLALRRCGISTPRIATRLGISPAGVRRGARRGRPIVDRWGL